MHPARESLARTLTNQPLTLLRVNRTSQRRHVGNTSTPTPTPPPHSLLPTGMLLRSFLIATVSSNRILLTPSLDILSFFTKPRSALLSVEKNPVLHALFKSTLYRHFCAGEDVREVKNTITNIKNMGFKGVILTYAREVVIDASGKQEVGAGVKGVKEMGIPAQEPAFDEGIEAWRQGVLETASMLEERDFLALKFTGAGVGVMQALMDQTPLPKQMQDALNEVCEKAMERKASILIDAEQQFVQPAIDDVAISLMRRYNRQQALVYNTYQAYLKSTPSTLLDHLHHAKGEYFTIGVKLVRGAYMNSEPRELINNTKQQTDNSYNSIAEGLLQRRYEGLGPDTPGGFPRVSLFLATHNKQSVLHAYQVQQQRAEAGLPLTKVQYGQLLGMADEVSCTLLQLAADPKTNVAAFPEAYKCLSWGKLGDCISYLFRRAVENRDAVSRTKVEYYALREEVWRRFKKTIAFG
ncbi:proline oxidase [Fusarium beomiforme]|uniref:Proline dehydrogenase n=1 Tax=Fusarium beomiforme TaxID=44412 RepID=A0A9P5AC32_9HYPO|nr:proline oxidase [Fusarium beomiforme]